MSVVLVSYPVEIPSGWKLKYPDARKPLLGENYVNPLHDICTNHAGKEYMGPIRPIVVRDVKLEIGKYYLFGNSEDRIDMFGKYTGLSPNGNFIMDDGRCFKFCRQLPEDIQSERGCKQDLSL